VSADDGDDVAASITVTVGGSASLSGAAGILTIRWRDLFFLSACRAMPERIPANRAGTGWAGGEHGFLMFAAYLEPSRLRVDAALDGALGPRAAGVTCAVGDALLLLAGGKSACARSSGLASFVKTGWRRRALPAHRRGPGDGPHHVVDP